MIIVKILIACISVLISIYGIIKINELPKTEYSEDENYKKISRYSTVGAFFDMAMVFLIIIVTPPAEYGNGFELIALLAAIVLYAPPCIITSVRLRRRMKSYGTGKRNLLRINALDYAVPAKAIFMAMVTLWISEVK